MVFVCEHGAAKSIIAAAEFNKLAEQKGLPQRAISRGTNPDPQFAPGVIEGMKKDRLPIPDGKPRTISPEDVQSADRVVTLGCKLPEQVKAQSKPEDWSDVPPPSQGYEASRTEIQRHVRQLIDELSKEKPTKQR